MSQDSPQYPPDLYRYQRRHSRVVDVGGVLIGGEHPIRVQSMITSDTLDTEASVKQVLDLAEVGCEIVRITAQTKRYAANLEHISTAVRAAGCDVPLVADIHFKPDAAMEAAKWVEKVRVNPGNYADKKKFEIREYSDDQYAEELERIREQFGPLVELCKGRGVAMRIGTNHGSLSDRIMNRYGDSPRGMVESALEFARIARELDYHQFMFSMKASNPKVMIEAYRLLTASLEAEGPDWNYPLHLGVTEAGDGEDGRIKSAIGIGSLLLDGIGDTVRVSLTEDAVCEIPVAQALVAACEREVRSAECGTRSVEAAPFDPFDYDRRASEKIEVQGVSLGAHETVRVFTSQRKFEALAHKLAQMGDFQPEIVAETAGMVAIDPRDDAAVAELNAREGAVPVTVADGVGLPVVSAFRLLAARVEARHPVVLKDVLAPRGTGVPPVPVSAASRRKLLQREAEALEFPALDENLEVREGGNLPHWEEKGAAYTVTFRLEDSLPREIVDSYGLEKRRLEGLLDREREALRTTGDESERRTVKRRVVSIRAELANLRSEILEVALDAAHGECWMQQKPEVATLIADALEFFDGERYDLVAYCVMPNHVHAVLRPLEAQRLSGVMHSIKSYTAKKANALIGRTGSFWQKESYDHLIRDADDYVNQVEYVLENPAKAGLDGWRWVGGHAAGRRGNEHQRDADATGAITPDFVDTLLVASANIGSLLCDGIGDAILIQGEEAPGQSMRLSYNVLQAAGTRIFKTDYVACPSCGRTLFDLQETTAKIRAATGHLKGVRIAVMGCIVNGPGEMADADFGYVGGAPAKINLYVGKQAVKFNIPQAEAVDQLVDLIKEHDKWVDAPELAASV